MNQKHFEPYEREFIKILARQAKRMMDKRKEDDSKEKAIQKGA